MDEQIKQPISRTMVASIDKASTLSSPQKGTLGSGQVLGLEAEEEATDL